jgi:uncharacterized protein
MTDFQTLQRQFAAHLRQPDQAPLPLGCDAVRMRHYHQLFFNNFDGVLDTAFIRLSACFPGEDWDRLVLSFFQTVPQHSPFLADVPARFVEYLEAQSLVPVSEGQMELAAYELACFELKSDQDHPLPEGLIEPAAWEAVRPVLNPASLFFESVFPVHDLAWNPLSSERVPTFLVLVRDSEGRVQTHALSPASARLLILLIEHPTLRVAQIVSLLADEIDQPEPVLMPHVAEQLKQWRKDEVLLGATEL